MTKPSATLWEIEPHTKAKHEILRRYLGAWFPILGSKIPRIVYIDGFCGPGRYLGGEDGSPIIALKEAIKQPILATSEVNFLFMDERIDRIRHLEKELSTLTIPKNFHVKPLINLFQAREAASNRRGNTDSCFTDAGSRVTSTPPLAVDDYNEFHEAT